ncbi:hypothetical protein [Stenotrophomonas sp. S39]|uniref:hypothetical protein n=1 Tax=Stenotrophomonas sp. S39 TaxID=2767451 RepID=UPI00190BEB39|nr:hypothetical protein [Stenotrophomonas sp. S39]MBK0052975.1 hypothetical protein [Stenotrophomonas sp. S39]
MNEKTFTWKEADELEKKLDKEIAALAEKQAPDRQRIEEARRASARDVLTDVFNMLSKNSKYLTKSQKARVSEFFKETESDESVSDTPKKERKPRTPKEDRVNNRFLHDGKKTPFYYGGKGPKPDILKQFEGSDAGVKLLKDNKPTYGDL